MQRRDLLSLPLLLLSRGAAPAVPPPREIVLPYRVHALTSGPRHHFFGYYGISPWNEAQTQLACLETTFQDHLPAPEEEAAVGLADARTGHFSPLTTTRAWNFQQGAMLHWHPLAPDKELLFNDRRGEKLFSVILDTRRRKRRQLPRAISAVSPTGRHALSLTYGRLTRLRPVVGYPGLPDPNPTAAHPDNDGIFLMDLAQGKTELIVTIRQVFRLLVDRHPELAGRHMWFNHTLFNRDGSRFLFLARCWTEGPQRELESAMFTAAWDGSDLREVVPFGRGVSHFEWRNTREIIATFRGGRLEKNHFLFTDGGDDFQRIGEGFLEGDGHCSVAGDGEWMVTDANHAATLEKELLVYHLPTGRCARLGRFFMKERRFFSGYLRCDLHPRWNRRGDQISIDAIAARDGTRQIRVVEVTLRA